MQPEYIGLYGSRNKLRFPSALSLPAVHWIEGHQCIGCRDHCEDREKMEGSQGSPTGRSLAETQGSAWECGIVQERNQEVNIDPIQHWQWEGEVE